MPVQGSLAMRLFQSIAQHGSLQTYLFTVRVWFLFVITFTNAIKLDIDDQGQSAMLEQALCFLELDFLTFVLNLF